jgi:hypothetical protein
MAGRTGFTEPLFAVEDRPFPRLRATSLDGAAVTLPDDARGSLALIAVAFPRWIQPVQETWAGPFEHAFTGNPLVKTYLVVAVAGPLGESLTGRVDEALRGALPVERHDRVLTYAGNLDEYTVQLGLDDISVAYLYLVDGEGVIRWAWRGTATPEGLDGLLNTARKLLAEYR